MRKQDLGFAVKACIPAHPASRCHAWPRLAAWALAAAALPSQAGVISPELERALVSRGTHADTGVIVRLAGSLDPATFAVAGRDQRDARVVQALRSQAERGRAVAEAQLGALGARRVRALWIIHGFAAIVPAAAVRELAQLEGIDRIDLDSYVQQGRSQRTPAPRARADRAEAGPADERPMAAATDTPSPAPIVPTTPHWNLQAVQAPRAWAAGHYGQGVVVASFDTGVDLAHPDLARRWRGGSNSWFDPHGEEATPHDALGHGTQALSVVLGGSGLGVAPQARWIAVKLFDAAGRARMSDIHQAFQWLLDPDGDPSTLDAPDVVNASWALTGRGAGACVLEFSEDLRALRAAGIAVVFAAGNDGPAARTSSSPGNNPQALSVGALDRHGAIASQTSRGPSACDGEVFPRLVAPGVDVRAADVSHGGLPSTTLVSGSSLAAPHVAGVLALLAGAYPAASLAELEAALLRGALDLGGQGADNNFGNGLVRAWASLQALEADLGRGNTHARGTRTLTSRMQHP